MSKSTIYEPNEGATGHMEQGYSSSWSQPVQGEAVPEVVKIEHLTSTGELSLLAGEWNGFLKRCGTDSVFLTWDYLSTWWDTFGEDYDLHTLVARGCDGELIGIAPMVTGLGEGFGRCHLRHLSFLGATGESIGEYEDFMVLRGRESEVVRAFSDVIFGELSRHWDVALLAMMPAGSACLLVWENELERHGARSVELNRYHAYYRPLPESWEVYLAERSGHFRSNFKRKWKKLGKTNDVKILKVGEDCSVEDAMEALIKLNRERWGDDGEAFLTEKFNRFHFNLAKLFDSKGWSSMSVIEVDGEVAAVCYGFAYAEKFSVLQFGWDKKYARQSIGLLALGIGQKMAMEDGLRELDLMSGGDEYKKTWATDSRELVDIEVANPQSIKALGFQRLRTLRDMVLPVS